MPQKASITKKGAILLGQNIACDAFDPSRPVRVVTHAHSDHLLGLRRSLKHGQIVVMTPATRDLINALKGDRFLNGNVKTLSYKEPFQFEDEELTLHYADHILGTAQVLVVDEDATKILYTSDFKIYKTPVVEADILVIEATYGNPYRVRPFGCMAEGILVSLVEQGLRHGTVYVIGYHGKLQEIMQTIYEAKLRVPIIASERIYEVTKVCEKHGMHFGKRLLLSRSEEAQAILNRCDPCIVFRHACSRKKIDETALRIYASGWQFGKPCQKIGESQYRVALSGHADFNELLLYVEKCGPKRVFTDSHRSKDARVLAQEIERRLKIPAQSLPN